ncbi:MAG TPA: Na+/H+ antiporter NhaA [Pirellulaceae bacterium]|jgi:NhaA family Na+:H+ antiporter|nr:Na+/H+ antiporter NhaA [Pirellulaceae bacterium]
MQNLEPVRDQNAHPEDEPTAFPDSPFDRWMTPVRRFLHIEAASGIVLFACAVAALVAANSPFAEPFAEFWHTKVALLIGKWTVAGDVAHLVVNDGLMTIFFFVVGLEIKREIVAGELRNVRNAILPVVAAIGGVLAPALVYLALQWGEAGQRGWAIPMATDIAFVVGVLALFGRRVPFGLKIFLLSLAIVDDLIAVATIALVFTESIAWGWVAAAGVGFAMTYVLNRVGLRQVGAYILIGLFIWFAFYKSGIHPTVAGVLLGILTPASAWVGERTLTQIVGEAWQRLRGQPESPLNEHDRVAELERLAFVAQEGVSPLHRLESSLHPWVAFGIMPIFALANAGVVVAMSDLANPVTIAVMAGLFIGKPLGILLFSGIAVGMRATRLPEGVTWGMMVGAACLAGIGFTMSLFLTTLSFPSSLGDAGSSLAASGKVGTLLGSLASAVVGSLLLLWAARNGPSPDAAE